MLDRRTAPGLACGFATRGATGCEAASEVSGGAGGSALQDAERSGQNTRAWKSPATMLSDGSVKRAARALSPVSLRWPWMDAMSFAATP